eukprot:Amastigsp_a685526_11.p3 type:complete len:143 gc:universal Amastigsp_a685526_11:452-24(-)
MPSSTPCCAAQRASTTCSGWATLGLATAKLATGIARTRTRCRARSATCGLCSARKTRATLSTLKRTRWPPRCSPTKSRAALCAQTRFSSSPATRTGSRRTAALWATSLCRISSTCCPRIALASWLTLSRAIQRSRSTSRTVR